MVIVPVVLKLAARETDRSALTLIVPLLVCAADATDGRVEHGSRARREERAAGRRAQRAVVGPAGAGDGDGTRRLSQTVCRWVGDDRSLVVECHRLAVDGAGSPRDGQVRAQR